MIAFRFTSTSRGSIDLSEKAQNDGDDGRYN
jgi:hypothetical protein